MSAAGPPRASDPRPRVPRRRLASCCFGVFSQGFDRDGSLHQAGDRSECNWRLLLLSSLAAFRRERMALQPRCSTHRPGSISWPALVIPVLVLAGLVVPTFWNLTRSDALAEARRAYTRGDLAVCLQLALDHLDRRPGAARRRRTRPGA